MSRRVVPGRAERTPGVLVGGLVLASLAGCTVDEEILDRRLFECDVESDCGEGWGCVHATPYAPDFCAPRCGDGQSCDGVCLRQQTSTGAQRLCLRGCRIFEDGTTSACPDGFSCIRTSVQDDEGVCYPAKDCEQSAACGPEELCVSEVARPLATQVGLEVETDNFYCVPKPNASGQCPVRSQPVALGTGAELCVATCDPPDTRCPPGAGCLQQLTLLGIEASVPCIPGVYGVPCDDDTNCVVGRCRNTGEPGRMCTVTCDQAARLAGGCGNLLSVDLLDDIYDMECAPGAGEGDGEGLCVARYEMGFPCTPPETDAYRCVEELECRHLAFGDEEGMKRCTKTCTEDGECVSDGDDGYFCLRQGAGEGSCFPERDAGQRCARGGHCTSGVCEQGRCGTGGAT